MRIQEFLKKLLTRQADVNVKIVKEKDDLNVDITKDKDRATPLDLRKAECPYCHNALDKVPVRKTKCPHCGEFIYVRTRPNDRARVVVTKDEADKIKEEWEKIHELERFFAQNSSRREEFEKERENLRKEFGKEPSDRDVMWRILNKELGKHLRRRNFSSYRSVKLEMAEILWERKSLEPALKMYLEVCYLDLNGPNDLGGIRDPELMFPAFEPQLGFLAPAAVFMVKEIMKELGFDKNRVKMIFIEHNSRIYGTWKLPLTPEDCWPSLEKEIENPNGHYQRRTAGLEKRSED